MHAEFTWPSTVVAIGPEPVVLYQRRILSLNALSQAAKAPRWPPSRSFNSLGHRLAKDDAPPPLPLARRRGVEGQVRASSTGTPCTDKPSYSSQPHGMFLFLLECSSASIHVCKLIWSGSCLRLAVTCDPGATAARDLRRLEHSQAPRPRPSGCLDAQEHGIASRGGGVDDRPIEKDFSTADRGVTMHNIFAYQLKHSSPSSNSSRIHNKSSSCRSDRGMPGRTGACKKKKSPQVKESLKLGTRHGYAESPGLLSKRCGWTACFHAHIGR